MSVAPNEVPFVDLHCHGALGAEFGGDEAGSRRAAAYHLANGARVVASLVSAPAATLERQVRLLSPLVADATLLGIHLEGPCLATARRGAHDPAALVDPDPALVERLAGSADRAGAPGAIKHWTFAPELPGAEAFVDALAAHRIRPAIGHTDADAPTVAASIELIVERTNRPALVTHLFNAMPPMHHRAGGPVAAALSAAARGEAVLELIADGVHVSPEVVRMIFDLIGPAAIALVSDAMSATGRGDGEFTIGALPVTVSDGVARLTDGGSIAGSTSPLSGCVRYASEHAGVPLPDAHHAGSLTPLGIVA